MQTRKPAFQVIDGVPRCVAAEPDFLREGLKFRAKKGDLVQSTFPESGTHWMLYITHLILREGHPITTYEEFAKEWRFLEYMNIKDFSSSQPLRTFVTHLALDKRTMTEEGKYVYIARNPWDVCVSFYHMATNMSTFEFQKGTFEEFFETFVSGNFGYGDYFEHVAAGYALREEPNVFFVTYEELKKNTREVVLRLAYFLGEQYGRALEKDEAFLQRVLERSKPEYMRNVVVVDLSAGDNPQWNEAFSRERITCIEGHEGEENKYSYVRNGKVGSWKDYFSPALLRKMEHRILEAEKQSSFMDLWKDIRVEARKRMQDTE
ncbi:3-beta-hydroxysteroid sulfotransferase isoform X3 [Rhipicephalus sanguineus]|uniref:3-beta-hydroxysteroid sulfotransferase isoform X3 n=1 Tax=Rhipicephalus sanguineus TaxID=34632 RepID=UPI0020C34148|nr:3-beta-hydroxysteroid sulfotransferase isoform X3 [Rhipicephalus sanguineus]